MLEGPKRRYFPNPMENQKTKAMKQQFAELELIMAIDDSKELLVKYAENRPAEIHDLINVKKIEIQIRLEQINLLSLAMARALSK